MSALRFSVCIRRCQWNSWRSAELISMASRWLTLASASCSDCTRTAATTSPYPIAVPAPLVPVATQSDGLALDTPLLITRRLIWTKTTTLSKERLITPPLHPKSTARLSDFSRLWERFPGWTLEPQPRTDAAFLLWGKCCPRLGSKHTRTIKILATAPGLCINIGRCLLTGSSQNYYS